MLIDTRIFQRAEKMLIFQRAEKMRIFQRAEKCAYFKEPYKMFLFLCKSFLLHIFHMVMNRENISDLSQPINTLKK